MQAGVMSRVISVTAEDLVTLPIRLAQLSRAPGRSHVSRSLRIFSREIVSTICEDVQLSAAGSSAELISVFSFPRGGRGRVAELCMTMQRPGSCYEPRLLNTPQLRPKLRPPTQLLKVTETQTEKLPVAVSVPAARCWLLISHILVKLWTSWNLKYRLIRQ